MKKPLAVIYSIAFVAMLALPSLRLLADEGQAVAAKKAGPLAEYVAREDASYGWTVRRRGKVGVTPYVELTLTSQTWRGIEWKH